MSEYNQIHHKYNDRFIGILIFFFAFFVGGITMCIFAPSEFQSMTICLGFFGGLLIMISLLAFGYFVNNCLLINRELADVLREHQAKVSEPSTSITGPPSKEEVNCV